jgi:eukaryotic-like serine/threonine-protein kinase
MMEGNGRLAIGYRLCRDSSLAQNDTTSLGFLAFPGSTPHIALRGRPDSLVTAPPPQLAQALHDRYRLQRELGRGGMATVYLAEDVEHGRLVALKLLHPELAAALGRERFLHEIRVTARLDHPHLLPVLASGEAAGLLWYTMPYVEGESLRDRLKRETQLPVGEALRLVGEVADALDYAHRHGVVHRDIKPENILLAHGHARVADFGIARALESAGGEKLTQSGLAIGTPMYMSPEQASGSGVDGRSDIYSLGCVLYEMLAGEPPFTGPTPQAVIVRRLFETPRPLAATRERLPAGIDPAVTKALARVPADRFATAAEFAEALAQAGSAAVLPAARTPGSLAARNQRLLALAALLILIGVAFAASRGFLTRRNDPAPAPAAKAASVAVLPFRNLGRDSSEEYLSDGITEDLINSLGQARDLRVVSRTSAFTFKGKSEDVRTVGARLGVAAVVEGSLRRVGDTLRVTAQLVNIADGYQLWSGRYDRPYGELLAIEDELSRAILRVLSPRAAGLPSSRARKATDNPEAYKLYLRANYHMGKLTEPDFRAALNLYDSAIGLDPTFALAYSGLSGAYAGLYGTFLSAAEGMPKAKAAALRALDLDSSLPEGYVALSAIQSQYEWDWRGAEQSMLRAIELNPSIGLARSAYGWLLTILGRPEEAAVQLNRARQLDPLDLNLEVMMAWPYYYTRRFDEAIELLKKTVLGDSSFVGAQFRLGEAYAYKGVFDSAEARLQAARALIGDHPDVLGRLGYVYARSGRREMARAIADTLRSRYRKGRSDEPYDLAVVYTGLGEKDLAIDWLDTAYAERSTWIQFAKVSPELDSLRSEPQFREFLKKLRLD